MAIYATSVYDPTLMNIWEALTGPSGYKERERERNKGMELEEDVLKGCGNTAGIIRVTITLVHRKIQKVL